MKPKKSITSVARIRRENNRTTTFKVTDESDKQELNHTKSSYQKSKHPHILNGRTDFLVKIICRATTTHPKSNLTVIAIIKV